MSKQKLDKSDSGITVLTSEDIEFESKLETSVRKALNATTFNIN